MDFSEWLRDQRERAGWTTQEVADKSGLSQPYIFLLEKEERRPSRKAVLSIAEAFGVNPDSALVAAGFVPGSEFSEVVELPSGRRVTVTSPSGEPEDFDTDDLARLDLEFDLIKQRKQRN